MKTRIARENGNVETRAGSRGWSAVARWFADGFLTCPFPPVVGVEWSLMVLPDQLTRNPSPDAGGGGGLAPGGGTDMKLAAMLGASSVQIGLETRTKEETLRAMLDAVAQTRPLTSSEALGDILARERAGGTVLLQGDVRIAVPHASTRACKQMLLAVATSASGVPWDEDGRSARLFFLLIGPAEAHALYLRLLTRIARLCQDETLVQSLLKAETPQQVIDLMAAGETTLEDLPPGAEMPSFCVLGAGHGGLAMAGHLALLGCRVNLFNRTWERIEPIHARGGIEVTGEVEGFAALNLATADPAQAVDNVDILMAVLPASAHRDIARIVAPHLKDGQILILNPGRTGGALEVTRVIRQVNPGVRAFVAEAQTLLYAARTTNPGQVHVFGIKNSVPVAALPAYATTDVLAILRRALPQFVPGDNILKTSLDNIGAVFHPAITLLNAGRIEDTHGDFEFYVQGVTPAVARVLEAIDRERVNVASALGIRAHTAREWLYLAYDAAGKTLYDAMRANAGYSGIKAPGTVLQQYITEDVPASLVPLASIGEMFRVPTPTIRAMIDLASAMHGVDYWAEGRTVEKLGIKGMSLRELRFMVVGADPGVADTQKPAAKA